MARSLIAVVSVSAVMDGQLIPPACLRQNILQLAVYALISKRKYKKEITRFWQTIHKMPEFIDLLTKAKIVVKGKGSVDGARLIGCKLNPDWLIYCLPGKSEWKPKAMKDNDMDTLNSYLITNLSPVGNCAV